jgi:uncharacterized protein (TIGR03086 family)
MTDISNRYRRLSDAFATTIAGVPAGRWSDPSPCEDWDARGVVRHVIETQGMFLRLVGRDLPPIPDVADDPAGAWDGARAAIQADLDDPERAGTEFDGSFGRTRFETAVDRFLCADLVMHRWDLARATGQDEHIDPADAQRLLDGAVAFGDAIRSPGVCGPPVPVPADADIQTRVIGFYGRQP